MNDPIGQLRKLLNLDGGWERFAATGENLDQLAEALRETRKCRVARRALKDKFRLDPAISPTGFLRLLDIPEIDTVETPTKSGDVAVSSLKTTRGAGDPVSVADLNVVLRELNRDLSRIRERIGAEFAVLPLLGEISENSLEKAASCVVSLRRLNARSWPGRWLAAWKIAGIEAEFRGLFPGSAHSLRKTLDGVERELEFYRKCLALNRKWSAVGLDVFFILRAGSLALAIQNVQELGNALWNAVYIGLPLKNSLELAGIRFTNVNTLFETAPLRD